MGPIVRTCAEEYWGDGEPGRQHKKWVYKCIQSDGIGPSIRQHMHEGSIWDAYVLGCVMWYHMKKVFLPAAIRDDDEACEHLRKCVHQAIAHYESAK